MHSSDYFSSIKKHVVDIVVLNSKVRSSNSNWPNGLPYTDGAGPPPIVGSTHQIPHDARMQLLPTYDGRKRNNHAIHTHIQCSKFWPER